MKKHSSGDWNLEDWGREPWESLNGVAVARVALGTVRDEWRVVETMNSADIRPDSIDRTRVPWIRRVLDRLNHETDELPGESSMSHVAMDWANLCGFAMQWCLLRNDEFEDVVSRVGSAGLAHFGPATYDLFLLSSPGHQRQDRAQKPEM
jgi:hypothetical protein